MYAFLRGKIHQVETGFVVLDVGGVGYKVQIPLNAAYTLRASGSETLLYTSFVVREFGHALYGFIEMEERDLFETLIEISGVGPKIALSLIGHLPLPKLQEVVIMEDAQALSKVPGIGKKTAERLLIELRNKLEGFTSRTPAASGKVDPKNQKAQDALKALINLGYNQATAQKAIKKSLQDSDELDLGRLVTTALKHV